MRWNKGRRPAYQRQALLNEEGIPRDVIVIGASAGGVAALTQLFAALPRDIPATLGVALHRGALPGALAQVLGRRSALPVIQPEGPMNLKRGVIYLAPAAHHLLFEKGRVNIQRGPKEHSTRPAVDPLFRSAATAYGERVVGVHLTGCGQDGVSGLIAITGSSGLSVAQDPDEAAMPYMPRNALRYDNVNGVFFLDEMAVTLAALATGEAVYENRHRAASG